MLRARRVVAVVGIERCQKRTDTVLGMWNPDMIGKKDPDTVSLKLRLIAFSDSRSDAVIGCFLSVR